MAANVFKSTPVQSAGLQQESIQPPADINTADPPPVLRLKRAAGSQYERSLKSAKSNSDARVQISDIEEARSYVSGCEVAILIPQISQAVQQVNDAQILVALNAIQQQLTVLRVVLSKIDRIDFFKYCETN
jgi:hypothetical protein